MTGEDRSGLAGRRVLITGAGAGIGAATASLLVGAGGRVAILDRDGEAAAATQARLGAGRAIFLEGDVTDMDAVGRILEAMTEAWGGIDDLVNNAGTWDHAPLLDLSLERWRRVLEVNLLAPVAISVAAARRMRPGGSIVNVSSVLGQVAAPERGPYCVSKAALIALTRMQAIEWAALGLRVNAVAPGYIVGQATQGLIDSGAIDDAAIRRRTPMGRFGSEAEVAAGIAFLLDPARSAYVSGHVLEVNGGWTAYGFV